MNSKIPQLLKRHYSETFKAHGVTARGVDWKSPEAALQRHEFFLKLFGDEVGAVNVLDLGCGYGAFLDFLQSRKIQADYTGIDLVPAMVKEAAERHPRARFVEGDFLEWAPSAPRFDYLVANGIFTQKLRATDAEIEEYLVSICQEMFKLCRKGIAMNFLTDLVDFRRDENFYYPPTRMIENIGKLSRKFRIDHTSSFFEYFVFVYK